MTPVRNEKLLELIPQRPPFVMIDEFFLDEGQKACSSFQIPNNHFLSINNLFQEAGLIENIAQTAAAEVGYHCNMNNSKVPTGIIGAVKNLTIDKFPQAGFTIKTEIIKIADLSNASKIKGDVFFDHEIIASAELNIF